MPGTNVQVPRPLVRLNPWYPSPFGISGMYNEAGLREHCTGTVFYVDPNYTGVTDLRTGTDPQWPLATVEAALTKCQAYRGDVIVVMANNSWQYGNPADGYANPVSEEVEVTVPGVSIIGVAPTSSMGVYWTPASDGGTCITVSAIDVLIEGFCFTEGAYTGCNGIYAEWDGATLFGENLTVRNCYFDDSVDIAIQLEYSWYCDIHNNVFSICDTYGIYVDAAGSGIAYASIHDNIFQECAIAMALLGGCDHNQVWGNSIYNANAQGGGAATNEGINTTGGAQNQVFDNYFSCVLPGGGAGDYDDLNTAAATDAWLNNHLLNGDSVTNPT